MSVKMMATSRRPAPSSLKPSLAERRVPARVDLGTRDAEAAWIISSDRFG
jgi:hypothetical protein